MNRGGLRTIPIPLTPWSYGTGGAWQVDYVSENQGELLIKFHFYWARPPNGRPPCPGLRVSLRGVFGGPGDGPLATSCSKTTQRF